MGKSGKETWVLAGDIGGTKTNMGFFQMGKHRPVLKARIAYASREWASLEDIINRFLITHSENVGSACFGIAGPVINGRCRTTNLPWNVSEERIRRRFKWGKVCLINDVAATAFAVPILNGREVFSLNKARARKDRNVALIAPGTGLGEALLVFTGKDHEIVPSEGGHADFAPNNKSEAELWKYLHRRFGHVSNERVISGPGLINIYSWLRDSGKYGEPAWLAERIQEKDPAKAIAEAAMEENDPLCVETMDMFVSVLGAVAGNLALTGMTTGGVYLGGGIPPKILPVLRNGMLIHAFQDKGRFSPLMEKISVKVILNDKAALLGAARYAFELL